MLTIPNFKATTPFQLPLPLCGGSLNLAPVLRPPTGKMDMRRASLVPFTVLGNDLWCWPFLGHLAPGAEASTPTKPHSKRQFGTSVGIGTLVDGQRVPRVSAALRRGAVPAFCLRPETRDAVEADPPLRPKTSCRINTFQGQWELFHSELLKNFT